MPHRVNIKKLPRGFVLLCVLIFMQILTLLSWFTVRSVLWQQKIIQQQYLHRMLLSQSDVILAQIEQSLMQTLPPCVIPRMNSAALLAKHLPWWRSTITCTGNFQALQYYYVVETLGRDLCASLMNTQTAADYFRITVFLQPQSADTQLYLQSTVIKSASVSTACAGKEHLVTSGRQSWRMMSV